MQQADDILLTTAQQGNRNAIVALYDKYRERVYRFVFYRVKQDVGLAEEISAETFTRLVQHIPTLQANGKPILAWLYTVAHNLIADHYRQVGEVAPLSADLAVTLQSPEQSAQIKFEYGRALDAMYELSADQRDVLIFRFLDELSVAETAAVMGIKQGNVKTLTRRGLQSLRQRLEVEHG